MPAQPEPRKPAPAASTCEARPKRKPVKFTGTAKVTLTALSLLGFIGGWNIIARVENQEAQADEPPATPVPQFTPTPVPPTPTPWPTIAALPELKPVPTLRPIVTANQQPAAAPAQIAPAAPQIDIAPIQIAPLPTLAPLPDMPAAPPPPPPMPVQPAGGWQNSGGS